MRDELNVLVCVLVVQAEQVATWQVHGVGAWQREYLLVTREQQKLGREGDSKMGLQK